MFHSLKILVILTYFKKLIIWNEKTYEMTFYFSEMYTGCICQIRYEIVITFSQRIREHHFSIYVRKWRFTFRYRRGNFGRMCCRYPGCGGISNTVYASPIMCLLSGNLDFIKTRRHTDDIAAGLRPHSCVIYNSLSFSSQTLWSQF